MDRWINKLAIVTGASSGIGEAISRNLVEYGVNVVGLARRICNMEKAAEELKTANGKFYPIQCDVRKKEDIFQAFHFVESLGGVDILVNNAGLAFPEYIIEGDIEKMENMLDVNLLSAAICTREAAKSMISRNSAGHIINMSSVLGYNVSKSNAPLLLYQTTKSALASMSEVVRNEISTKKAPIKVTTLAPGLVKTKMPIIETCGGDELFKILPHLQSKDVVDAVLYVLGTPEHVQITDLIVSALHEVPFITPAS